MREQYAARRAALNSPAAAKEFHSLFGREIEYIDRLLAWVNAEASARPRMRGVDDAWRARRAEFQREMRRVRGLDKPGVDGPVVRDGGQRDSKQDGGIFPGSFIDRPRVKGVTWNSCHGTRSPAGKKSAEL